LQFSGKQRERWYSSRTLSASSPMQ